MDLLACEITAKMGRDPAQIYDELRKKFGDPVYERIDAPASTEQKEVLKGLSPHMVTANSLAGEPIIAKQTRAPGNDAPIGGLKVVAENGWFAARPSGTEEIYKIYAESFKGKEHLEKIKEEAQDMVNATFKAAGV
jgi:phosphoglucomutase